MKDLALEEMRYHLFSPDELNKAEPLADESYKIWKAIWTKTFRELDGSDRIFSDDFTRQTRVGAITYKKRCISLGLFREVNFDSPAAQDDSYFKVWPEAAIQRLISQGKRVVVGSNISIDPEFQGACVGTFKLRNLILGMMIKTFLEGDFDVMTGTMRCNRGMHKSAYLLGGTPLVSDITHHGVDVDLVAFYRSELSSTYDRTKNWEIERLWKLSKQGSNLRMELRRAG